VVEPRERGLVTIGARAERAAGAFDRCWSRRWRCFVLAMGLILLPGCVGQDSRAGVGLRPGDSVRLASSTGLDWNWPGALLVLGWLPMLVRLRSGALRPGLPSKRSNRRSISRLLAAHRPAPERGVLPAVPTPGGSASERLRLDAGTSLPPDFGPPRERAPLFDVMLVALTWIGCASQTWVALVALRGDPADPRVVAGIWLFLLAMIGWQWARGALGDVFAQPAYKPARLVTDGAYRRLRHPLYTCTAIGCLGHAIAGGTWVGFAIWIGLVAVLAARARREDALLEAAFPGEWRPWAARVRF
jgi:protein-S-isoprenylcysteine O-methyltransferase Ste14